MSGIFRELDALDACHRHGSEDIGHQHLIKWVRLLQLPLHRYNHDSALDIGSTNSAILAMIVSVGGITVAFDDSLHNLPSRAEPSPQVPTSSFTLPTVKRLPPPTSMKRFQAIALLSAVYLLQADAFGLRSPIENPLAHRHLATCPTTTGVDYLGNDIKHVSGVQVSDCCSLCSQTSGCGAFTWTSYQGGTCWLKSAKGNTAANAAATSAVLVQDPPGCTLKDGYDYQDNDIANVQNTNNPGACCSICSSWPGCNAFSWSNYNGGTCWLKSKKGTEVPKAGVKSAEVKNNVGQCTLQPDMDFVDNDIGNAPGKSASDCCGICHNWSGCRSFSWSNQNGGTCWLKSAKGKTQYKAGVISSQLLDNPPPACTLEPGVDYVDNDLSNVPGAKPGDCCNKCRDTVGCHAFSWSNHNTGTCWLKSSKGSTVNKGGVTSAVVF